MSWTDKFAPKQILQMRDDFGVNTFVETGSFKGNNLRFHAKNFQNIIGCELKEEYFKLARKKIKGCTNTCLLNDDSSQFLIIFAALYRAAEREDTIFFYLDAHFYDSSLPREDMWVVIKELKALKGFPNCIICIHDFDCQGLGHLVYDGEHLNFDLVGPYLKEVNPDFFYYTNTKEWSGSITEEMVYTTEGLVPDEGTIDNIRFANSNDTKKYRGILYCTPRELDLSKYELVKGFS